MSKMKFNGHEIEFDTELMNLFKLDVNSFKETINGIFETLAKTDNEKEISLRKIENEKEITLRKVESDKEINLRKAENDKEISLRKVENDKEIKKYYKCHSTFNGILESGMDFLSDFTKGKKSSSEYLDNKSDEDIEKEINENYTFVN